MPPLQIRLRSRSHDLLISWPPVLKYPSVHCLSRSCLGLGSTERAPIPSHLAPPDCMPHTSRCHFLVRLHGKNRPWKSSTPGRTEPHNHTTHESPGCEHSSVQVFIFRSAGPGSPSSASVSTHLLWRHDRHGRLGRYGYMLAPRFVLFALDRSAKSLKKASQPRSVQPREPKQGALRAHLRALTFIVSAACFSPPFQRQASMSRPQEVLGGICRAGSPGQRGWRGRKWAQCWSELLDPRFSTCSGGETEPKSRVGDGGSSER